MTIETATRHAAGTINASTRDMLPILAALLTGDHRQQEGRLPFFRLQKGVSPEDVVAWADTYWQQQDDCDAEWAPLVHWDAETRTATWRPTNYDRRMGGRIIELDFAKCEARWNTGTGRGSTFIGVWLACLAPTNPAARSAITTRRVAA